MTHTAKCLTCGRIRRFRSAEAAAKAAPSGRICRMKLRLAAIAEAVKGFAATQVEKARELIADGEFSVEDAMFVQVATPSRERVDQYRILRDDIDRDSAMAKPAI